MRRISGDINAAHPRLNEVVMSVALVSDRHDVSEGIMVKSAILDAAKNSQAV